MTRAHRPPARTRSTRTSPDSSRMRNLAGAPSPGWTFLSNHGHVLICLAQQPDATLRQVADRVGITERSVQSIVADLVDARVLARRRDGRRNRYHIHDAVHLRHPVESHCTVASLIEMVVSTLPRK